ncbi:TlpA family protein disulfide reductase [Nocardioides sp. NPDC051685]|uniref:TlpA family protein disulfide reductase n=1 Tax=Nocardioides sp. NPDC051685 TaxID=3364334 RepID=UPI0037A27036
MRPNRIRRRTLLGLVAAGIVATLTLNACGTNAPTDGTAASADTAATLTSLSGQKITLPAAGRPTAVFFFSVGCGECAGGMKSLGQAAADAHQAGVKASFLAVDVDPGESADTINEFMKSIDAEQVPSVIDADATLTQRYQVAALSTLIVVDGNGKVTYRATDPSAETITAELNEAGA